MKRRFLLLLYIIAVAKGVSIQETLHNGNSQFTARMFSEVIKENQDQSVVLSAFSVITPLSQLAVASEGPAHDEILSAVGFPDDDTTNAVFALVDEKFNSVQGVELKRASKLYIPLGYQVHDEFANVSKYVYHSEIANINFNDNENSANEINTWVENQTNQRIKNLVNPGSINSDTRGVLVNALYFKGSWKYPFKVEGTRDENFYVNKQKTLQIPIMHNKKKYRFKESKKLNSKILELPYDGDQSSLIVVLPNDVEGIGQLLEKLKNPNILDQEISSLMNFDVRVSIPKFKIETTTDLKKVLRKINVTKIFGKDAQLTKLLKTNENLFISDAVQKAFIEVNEEGTEAAAANAFVVSITSVSFDRSFDFIADHPFAFFLKIHDEIIFNGVFYGT